MSDTLQPRDEADLAEIIATATQPLEPLAGGSKRPIGRPVAARALQLSALSGIIDYQPDELVLTARAATPLTEIERALGERGQRLAFEPPQLGALLGAAGEPTLGGTLAANSSGSRRFAAGAARDHFLGFRAVSGRGERFKGGGRVVKNVTGYDLPKLLAGSWGTLAVLTEVTVRVHPAPECTRTLLFAAGTVEQAAQIFRRALAIPCDVSGAAFEPGRGVALRLEGFEPSVQSRGAQLLDALGRPEHAELAAEEAHRFWQQTGGGAVLADERIVWRLSVPPQECARIVRALAPERYLVDWGGGLLWIGAQEADAARVRGALSSGHALLIKAPPEVRAATAVFQPLPAPLAALTARLKAAFDPSERLNPGRMS